MKYNFHVGDYVRFRQWDDMEEEYGLSESGSIRLPRDVFSKGMMYLCGQTFVIEAMRGDYIVSPKYLREDGKYGSWNIFTSMLEPVSNPINQCSAIEMI